MYLIKGAMRMSILAFLIAVTACAQKPTEADKDLAAFVEQHVVLPQGSPGPECYKRYYQIVDTANSSELPLSLKKSGRRLLLGKYFPVREPRIDGEPGIFWVENERELKDMFDGGCSQINVLYLPGDPPQDISATCNSNINGEIPKEVVPFSC